MRLMSTQFQVFLVLAGKVDLLSVHSNYIRLITVASHVTGTALQ